ncbi:hypothetical protein ABG088_10005 [Hydrogenibacillus schlegelii]|uniref:hypothetical protein n=1 Tax=Hydrogenibacillus schlegelii TaxID=1484 RepID=UPI0012E831CF|nr:hypothetical protein [Hydrogenibacillus schlegelii]
MERLIRYVRENFWPGRRFTNLADLYEQAQAWCARANRRVHGTTGVVPAEQPAREPLQPVPERQRLEHMLVEARKVSRDRSFPGAVTDTAFPGIGRGRRWW